MLAGWHVYFTPDKAVTGWLQSTFLLKSTVHVMVPLTAAESFPCLRNPVSTSLTRQCSDLPTLSKILILKLVHKFTHHHDKLPAIFSNYFTKSYMFHSYNTHTKDSSHVDLFASSMGQRSIKDKGSTLWNTLPEEIKSITSTVLFVNKLHKILL